MDFRYSPTRLALSRLKDKAPLNSGDLFGAFDPDCNIVIWFNDRHHPAVDFARQHNCPEILGRYRLPDGMTGTDVQTVAMGLKTFFHAGDLSEAEYEETLSQIWAELMGLNPTLRHLDQYRDAPMNYLPPRDKPMKPLFHLIMGVGDQFNPADIEHFMKSCARSRAEIFNGAAEPDAQMIEVRNKLSRPFWKPSPHTMDMLSDLIKKRDRRVTIFPKRKHRF